MKTNTKIRIKLSAYDHQLLNKSAERIIKAVKPNGDLVTGPIPLPTKRHVYTVLRSPHVNKKSRELFEQCKHALLLDIYATGQKTVEALMKLELPSGIDVMIKA